jgi:hypothetical protein
MVGSVDICCASAAENANAAASNWRLRPKPFGDPSGLDEIGLNQISLNETSLSETSPAIKPAQHQNSVAIIRCVA